MPIYEYECNACGCRFEEWQKITDEPVKVCPDCQAPEVQRLISHTSFQLKGGGWYGDLYASTRPSQSSTSSESPNSGDSCSDGKKTAASTANSNKSEGGQKAKAAAA